MRCFACAVSLATWLLFTGLPARCVVLRVRFPGPLASCSLVCPLGALACVCGALGHLAPVRRCARSVCCVACAVSLAICLLLTGLPARCVALRLPCPGSLGSCSWVRPRGLLCCVCGVLGHLALVHRCACSEFCVACVVSWATWLLFTVVRAPSFALLVQYPGPLGSCSPMCRLGVSCCVCGVPDHLAIVYRCAHSVRCFACAVSGATWLLFTGVPARCVVLLVRCPGPLGSCSPVCALRPLLFLCRVLGHLAPATRCAGSVCCAACAVCRATWLLITGVLARCVALCVLCPGPLGSCSPVHLLGVSCWLCSVLGHLAPVHRCARSVCCAVGCVCGVVCVGGRCGPHTQSIRTAAVCSLKGLGTLKARTRPSRRRLFVPGKATVPSGHALVHPDGGRFVAGRGWVRCGARTRPSGRRLFVAGRGWVPSWRALLYSDGGWCCLATVLVLLFFSVFCALSEFAAPGGRCCLAPVRVPWLWPAASLSGVPRGPAWCAAPRSFFFCSMAPSYPGGALRRASSCLVALCAPVRLPDAVVPFPRPGACAPGFTGWLRGARGGWPRTGLILPAAGPHRGGGAGLAPRRTCSGPTTRLSLAGPSGAGLWLRALRWLACADPLTDTSGCPCLPSFAGGLGGCTGAVSCGRRYLPLWVGGRHARASCVCACARPSWPGLAGWPPGRVPVRLTLSFGRFVFLLCSAPTVLGLPLSCSFVCLFFFIALFPLCASIVSCFLWFPAPGAFGLGALFFFPSPPVLVFFPPSCPLCAPVVSGFLWFPAPGALALGDVCFFFVGPPLLSPACALAAFVFPDQPRGRMTMDVFSMPEFDIGREVSNCSVLCVDRHSGYIVAVPSAQICVSSLGSGSYDG